MENYDDPIEMPHSLKELQDWYKTHPAPKPIIRASNDPTSIMYNERKLDMPTSLRELQNWNRTPHASGGDAHDDIAKAMHLARTHFGFGGDADVAEGSRYSENISHDTPSGEDRDRSWSRDYDSSLGISDNNDRGNDNFDGRMGRGLPEGTPTTDFGRFGFGQDFDTSGANLTGHDMPTGLINYTEQRLDTPYEGTLLDATMNPGAAFGMIYPDLVNKQLSKEGAIAFLANLGYESTQDGKVFNPQAAAGSGYGLAQWTDPKRQQEFFSAMIQPGQALPQTDAEKRALLASTTPQQQLGYALKEALGGGYGPSAKAMMTPGNLAEKVAIIEKNYEGAGIPAIDRRIALAKQIANNTGYGTFAQNTFSDTPTSVYAKNIPTPVARPADLNAAQFASNVPMPITRPADSNAVQLASNAADVPMPLARPTDLSTANFDPYGMSRVAAEARNILSARNPAVKRTPANVNTGQYYFIGSLEDPELIAQEQARIAAMRGYASGGKVDEDIAHALRIAQNMGRGNDTILAHINPREAALLKKHGGSGKINPYTGLREFDDEGSDNSDSGDDSNDRYRDMMNQSGWDSEDPHEIANFNAHNAEMGYGDTGPKTYMGELAVGQRTPEVMVPTGKSDEQGQPIMAPHMLSAFNTWAEDLFAPKFVGIDTPQYQDILKQKGPDPRTVVSMDNRGGSDNQTRMPLAGVVPVAQVAPPPPATPIVPYVAPPPFVPTAANMPSPYKDYGASASTLASAYTNPALRRFLPNQTSLSPYQNPYLTQPAARGGTIQGNNALANALRMAMGNKS
jgi:Phage tail lysozyme